VINLREAVTTLDQKQVLNKCGHGCFGMSKATRRHFIPLPVPIGAVIYVSVRIGEPTKQTKHQIWECIEEVTKFVMRQLGNAEYSISALDMNNSLHGAAIQVNGGTMIPFLTSFYYALKYSSDVTMAIETYNGKKFGLSRYAFIKSPEFKKPSVSDCAKDIMKEHSHQYPFLIQRLMMFVSSKESVFDVLNQRKPKEFIWGIGGMMVASHDNVAISGNSNLQKPPRAFAVFNFSKSETIQGTRLLNEMKSSHLTEAMPSDSVNIPLNDDGYYLDHDNDDDNDSDDNEFIDIHTRTTKQSLINSGFIGEEALMKGEKRYHIGNGILPELLCRSIEEKWFKGKATELTKFLKSLKIKHFQAYNVNFRYTSNLIIYF
jgi:hypothetical protein